MKELFERAETGSATSFRDLHIILDAMPVAMSWATLPGGDIRFVNRAFIRLFGYPESRFATVDEWIAEVYATPAERRTARERWAALWRGDQSGIAEIDPLECRVRCADGTYRTTLHRGTLLWDVGIGIATFEDISDRKIAEDAIRRIALEDPLTELANRRALHERWETEVTSAPTKANLKLGVLLVDLDGFKPVNDRLGHEAGDQVLKMVADRLRNAVRDTDLVGRIGGDEFVVLLSSLQSDTQAEAICDRISATFDAPFVFDGETITLGASIGVSLYPQDATELAGLIRQADLALYRRKRTGRGGWEWFSNPAA
ncbi:diguanylate cyclase domain-containing protein (plasmid) [Agrobacterium rosae]|uniref:Sensor domain-containing diguanylate cyclase n=1 Tax=Agrobacterium rosae TaxID=1972867 RepID=A0ABU4W4D5_9HYPH|nr:MULTISPECIES: sensor domain-containing diguanylate cyclase [Agrobacterium]MDX8311688.1 sensor domain-containing diguanylate cyclase [Agrobacterium sp. rho-13.3]MDX8332634.1 sensor domain-containing diguanylate cyclase [Agrobacterium rosae]